MMYKYFILLLSPYLFIGCVNNLENTDTQEKKLPRELTVSEEELIRAEQQFSYEIFKSITEEEDDDDNVLVSPISLALSLGMVSNGAFGETREEMLGVLNSGDMELPELNNTYQSIMELLLSLDLPGEMKMAHGLWHRDYLPVKEDFITTAEDYFQSEVRGADFGDWDAADIINAWMENRTEGYIKDVVRSVSRFTRMLLINGAYVNGDWLYAFDPESIRLEEFYPEDGPGRQTDMMQLEAELAGYTSDEVQMIELPYADDVFRMTLLLPGNQQQSIKDFIEEMVTVENVSAWTQNLSSVPTSLVIPRFDLESEYDLQDALESMGMDEAFERSADFYYISESEELFLNDFRHKSRIVVDEGGRNDAPASAPEVERSIHLNRPFVFLIRDHESGVILFMGKVANPSG